MSLYVHVCLCSLAIHPDQVRVATGQVAGHDQKEGKVGGQSSMSINITMSIKMDIKKCFVKKILSSICLVVCLHIYSLKIDSIIYLLSTFIFKKIFYVFIIFFLTEFWMSMLYFMYFVNQCRPDSELCKLQVC